MTFLKYRDVLRKVLTLRIPTELSRENVRASVLWDTYFFNEIKENT